MTLAGLAGRVVFERGYGISTKQLVEPALDRLVGVDQQLLDYRDVNVILDLDRHALYVQQIEAPPFITPQLGEEGRHQLVRGGGG